MAGETKETTATTQHRPSEDRMDPIVDMDDLYCDDDEEEPTPQIANYKSTKLTAFEYPSKEAKTLVETKSKNKKAQFQYPSKEAKQDSPKTKAQTNVPFKYPSKEAKEDTPKATTSKQTIVPFKYLSKEAKQDSPKTATEKQAIDPLEEDVDMDELFCDVDDEDKPNKTTGPAPPKVTKTATKAKKFQYPSKEAKKDTPAKTKATAAIAPETDMGELFCNDEDEPPSKNSGPKVTPKAKVKPFEYPSKEAKKDIPAKTKADIAPETDMDELFCDVDDEKPNKSGSTQPKTPKTATKSSGFQYPSKEAKRDTPAKTDSGPKIAAETDMDELFCDVDDEKPKNVGSTQPQVPKTATKAKTFQYPSKEAKSISKTKIINAAAEIATETDMDELFCDVDGEDEKPSNSGSTKKASDKETPVSTFQYPSKEAKSIPKSKTTNAVAEIATETDMDELFCDVDGEDEKPSNAGSTKKASDKVTPVSAFQYPSKEAKRDTTRAPAAAVAISPQEQHKSSGYPSKEAKRDVPAPAKPPKPPRQPKNSAFEYPSKEGKQDDRSKANKGNQSTAVPLDASSTHRMNRSRHNYDSDDDGEEEDNVNRSNTSNASSLLEYDKVTHREKARMSRRRRSRRDYDSDEESGDSDSFSDDGTDNRTRRSSQATRATINSEVYNSVGAVAVYSTGVVSQRPAVLTQSEHKMHYEAYAEEPEPIEEESHQDPAVRAGIRSSKTERTSKELDRSIPLGDDDYESSDGLQQTNDESSYVDATVDSLPSRTAGVTSVPGLGKKKPDDDIFYDNIGDDEKSVNLPWYWSPFFWVMAAVLVVALGVIVAVVVVVGGKEPKELEPEPTPSPTTMPLDQVKTDAFERHIGGIDSTMETPQLEAYRWLITQDEITNFSTSMSEDDIEIMKTRYSLAVLYHTLGGKNWFSSGAWLERTLGHCQWYNIDCKPIGQETPAPGDTSVFGIDLTGNNLQGSLPSELTFLSKLQYLLLKENRIESVKAFENGLDSLQYLVLSDNPLQDHEYLFRLTNLLTLQIVSTKYSGTLPAEMRQLSNMQSLDLSKNDLSGPFTNRFQTMSNLFQLNLDYNLFTGTLEDLLDCGDCNRTLTTLRSRQNPLTGSIPERLFDFSRMEKLTLGKTQLTGTIPSGFGKLTLLQELDLYENYYFSDTNVLPTEIGNLNQLNRLRLSDSVIGGTVPEELVNLSSLRLLSVELTFQNGSIPDGICAIPSLERIEHSESVSCSCPGEICVFFSSDSRPARGDK